MRGIVLVVLGVVAVAAYSAEAAKRARNRRARFDYSHTDDVGEAGGVQRTRWRKGTATVATSRTLSTRRRLPPRSMHRTSPCGKTTSAR